ncbi:MAG TPA: hypothetical protein VGN86_18475, partial [Pyrinomonadaceae bacterium]|nr:hypothetical protein [Pyrinomonadaceae bacterium]
MGRTITFRVISVSVLLTCALFLFSSTGQTSSNPASGVDQLTLTSLSSLPEFQPALIAEYHGLATATNGSVVNRSVNDHGGIHEQIPSKYQARYDQWKREFLTTETGRQQWDSYQNNPNFTLTIVVARDNAEGGTTGNYKWNEAGKLVAATITLGCRLDAGVPNPVYFPVMNSLLPSDTTRRIDGQTLAATKMAHEFGHVNRTVNGDADLYQ